MSEELLQKGLRDHGLKIGNYEFYSIGNTTLNQLKKAKIIPNKEYAEYGIRKPDGLLVDRRNKKNIKVFLVLEYKKTGKFSSEKDQKSTIQQCNDLCQVLNAPLGIATDGDFFIWFNPEHADPKNNYKDKTTNVERSYTLITDENNNNFQKEFYIDQKIDEEDLHKLNVKTREGLRNAELIIKNISAINSKLQSVSAIDPTNLAKQIWQDVWSVSGATPERCLYTFVELFMFKYLSDLGILVEDYKGNKVNFKDIYALAPEKAFINYSENVRPHLKKMFPENPEDGTTIINGTVLNPNVPEHARVFYKLLTKFEEFGEMKNIDPSFKSKVFENFMKESISKKNWGQFFTPRNIIDAVIEISDIEKLSNGSEVCDPACGVGGFILEPIRVKEGGLNYYYKVEGDELKPRYKFSGFDKGFEREEQLTIILAKANSLIFLSELLQKNPTISEKFAQVFNDTFKLLSSSILGTLSFVEKDKYDLILTNPPYVTSGSSNYKDAIKNDAKLNEFYRVNAMGVEGLFMEWIVRSLKPSRKAFIVIPDGILNRQNDAKLRKFLREECIIDGIVSLPVNAFYKTPKKTYILAITKKQGKTEIERHEEQQKDPVFTYLVSDIGETLDVNRFPIAKNDLSEMASLFNQFKGAKTTFHSFSPRCKIEPIEKFVPDQHWSVDRWWTIDEKIELGIEKEEEVLTLKEFQDKFQDAINSIEELNSELKSLL